MWQICCRIVVSSSAAGVRWWCCSLLRVAGVRVVEFGPYSIQLDDPCRDNVL